MACKSSCTVKKLKRDIVIKAKFALVDVLEAIVVSLTMQLGDFLLWVPKIGACWFCCIFLDDG